MAQKSDRMDAAATATARATTTRSSKQKSKSKARTKAKSSSAAPSKSKLTEPPPDESVTTNETTNTNTPNDNTEETTVVVADANDAPASSLNISIDELKRALILQRQANGGAPSKPGSLTIGSSSTLSSSRRLSNLGTATITAAEEESGNSNNNNNNATTSSSPNNTSNPAQNNIIPDLFCLEQAFSEWEGEEELKEGIEELFFKMHHAQQRKIARPSHGNMPIAWKTPFEVDKPRGTPNSFQRSNSPTGTTRVGLQVLMDPTMTEEQNAWAGIDELLEQRSLDGSMLSTTDILPGTIVRAMKRDISLVDVMQDSKLQDLDQVSDHPTKTLAEMMMKVPNNSDGEQQQQQQHRRKTSDTSCGTNTTGSLFDLFHWSEKANVDESRIRKKKLNQKKYRATFAKPTFIEDFQHYHPHHNNNNNLNNSIPSLATIRDEDEDVINRASGSGEWESFGAEFEPITEQSQRMEQLDIVMLGKGEFQQQQQEQKEKKQQQQQKEKQQNQVGTIHFLDGTTTTIDVGGNLPPLGSYKLDPVRGVHQRSSSSSSNGKTSKKKKKRNSDEESTTSAAQDLPSLSSFSTMSIDSKLAEKRQGNKQQQQQPQGSGPQSQQSKPKGSGTKKVEEKQVRLSIPTQLKHSIKKITTKTPKNPNLSREEEKFFPEDSKPEDSKFNANSCLLNGDETWE